MSRCAIALHSASMPWFTPRPCNEFRVSVLSLTNLRVLNRELVFEPRGAWKLVANQGVFAHHEKVAPVSGATSSHGESRHDRKRRGRDSNPRYRPKSV